MLKILVADNYNIHRIGLVQILIDAFPGAAVDEVIDVDALLNKAVTQKWDVIIYGFILPVEKGIDMVQKIKETDPATPLAVCGMQIQQEDITRFLDAGASAFVDKGAKASSIVQQVNKILSAKK